MITTRTPLRITLGGGGSDLETGHGICLAATIDKYVTVTVSESWDDDYLLHYSQTERVKTVDEIQHRIIRDVFRALDVPPGIQVSSHADVPAGTGLGNSGAFTVGLIKALRPELSPLAVAKLACGLDIGQQDQWSAAFGGMNVYDFEKGTVRPVTTHLDKFELYYTGLRHDAAEVLTGAPKPKNVAASQVKKMVAALEADDLSLIGQLLTQQWLAKLKEAPTQTHLDIADDINYLFLHGVFRGAKLVGAGDGGFILFVSDQRDRLESAAKDKGLRRLPFRFTHEGARCV